MNFKVATFFGIPLKLNIFTLLFIVWIYVTSPNEAIEGIPLDANVFATGIFCVMLIFVIMHEYGHCLMARRLGWKVADITIYPLGGLARMETGNCNPRNEFLVTAAGPFVNVVLAFLFAIATTFVFMVDQDALALIVTLFVLMMINVTLFAFNMLPIFPMDGGRLFRASLTYWMGHEKATRFAVKFGQILGLIFIIFAFCYGFYLTGVLLGIVIISSQQEITNASIVGSLQNIRRKAAIILNKPELQKASLAELTATLEAVEDEEIRKTLQLDELLPMLQSFDQEKTAI